MRPFRGFRARKAGGMHRLTHGTGGQGPWRAAHLGVSYGGQFGRNATDQSAHGTLAVSF